MDGQSDAGSKGHQTNYVRLDHGERGVDEADGCIQDMGPNGEVKNVYVCKRNFIHQLMDVALVMANVSQLKALLSLPDGNKYFNLIFVFIVMSITLQVVFTFCMLVVCSLEKKIENDEKAKENLQSEESRRQSQEARRKRRQKIADYLDRLGNVLVLMVIVCNVFITGFGIESHHDPPHNVGTPTRVPSV